MNVNIAWSPSEIFFFLFFHSVFSSQMSKKRRKSTFLKRRAILMCCDQQVRYQVRTNCALTIKMFIDATAEAEKKQKKNWLKRMFWSDVREPAHAFKASERRKEKKKVVRLTKWRILCASTHVMKDDTIDCRICAAKWIKKQLFAHFGYLFPIRFSYFNTKRWSRRREIKSKNINSDH